MSFPSCMPNLKAAAIVPLTFCDDGALLVLMFSRPVDAQPDDDFDEGDWDFFIVPSTHEF